MYVCEWDMCWRNFVTFPWWLKNVKSRSKIALFSNERHFEIWFQKKKTLTFSEENYLNYTKRPDFECGNYIFPKTRGNKNKPWTHSTLVNLLYVVVECRWQVKNFTTFQNFRKSNFHSHIWIQHRKCFWLSINKPCSPMILKIAN